MKFYTTRHIGFISCFLILTALTYWPASGQVTLIADVCPGSVSSLGTLNRAVIEDYIYFAANDCVNGEELWRTNGTPGGTEMVADIFDGSQSSTPRSLTNIEGTLFFSATDGNYGTELWKFDPDTGKTEMVADISYGADSSTPRNLIQLQDVLFFYATTPSLGYELWRSDGTESGTVLVKDIMSGPGSTLIFDMLVVNDLLFFWGDDGFQGRELWRSDGTEKGTEIVDDIFPGSQSALIVLPPWTQYGVSYPESARLTKIGDRVFFFASDGISGSELWASDGTKTGTVLVKDINPGPASSYPSELVYTEDFLFLAAADATNGRELRMLDATILDVATFDINPGNADSSPSWITPGKDNVVFFSANDGTNGRELWAVDGKNGPTLVADINPGGTASNPNHLFFDDRPNNSSKDGLLLFSADDGVNGQELWTSAIYSPFHTQMVHEFTPDFTGGSAKDYTKIGSRLVFINYGTGYGIELWRLDVGNPGNLFSNFTNEDIERVLESTDGVPTAFKLDQNYPNPFNPSTVINFTLPESGHVRLSVFDTLGREVRTLVDGVLSMGRHQVTLRADDLPSGTYLYRMESPGFTSSRMMHLTK